MKVASYTGDEYINCVFYDKQGNLWIGTRNDGIYKLKQPQNLFTVVDLSYPGMDFSVMNYFYADRQYNVYIGTTNGIACINLSNEQQNTSVLTKEQSPRANLFQDKELNYWFTDQDRLLYCDHSTGKQQILLSGLKKRQHNYRGLIFRIAEIGDIILAAGENYIFKYDKKTRQSTIIDPTPCRIWNKTFYIEAGKLWLKDKDIFYNYDPIGNKCHIFSNIPEVDRINAIQVLSDSILLLNIRNKLYFYNLQLEKVTRTLVMPGNPSNKVRAMIRDYLHNVWMSTLNGLFLYEQSSGNLIMYYYEDGTEINRFLYPSDSLIDGRLIFGTNKKILIVDPSQLKNQDNSLLRNTPLRITRIVIADKRGGDSSIVNPYLLNSIELPYYMNSLSIEFAVLSYMNPHRCTYAYRIKDGNGQWQNLGPNHRIDLLNLDNGTHTIEIKAAVSQGYWINNPVEFTIVILPPWYKTILFRIILILLLLVAIYSVFALRLKQSKQIRLRLEKEVRERTKEIEMQKAELVMQAGELRNSNMLLVERKEELEAASEELRAQSEELHMANTELTRLNATKDKFFSIIAHDLKNPFSGILSASELLDTKYAEMDDMDKRRFVSMIRSSAKGAYQLLQNLLEWARTQTKGIKFNPEYFKLNTLVNETIDLVKMNADQKNIRLLSSFTNDFAVYADVNMIRTVLRNLITNAIKFTPENGKIEVMAFNEGQYVKVMVKDSGVGMSAETVKKLFKIEESVSTTGTSGESGTGLGLILCKDFVEANSGSIRVESQPGDGSCFIFTIPLSDAPMPFKTSLTSESERLHMTGESDLESDTIIDPNDELYISIDEKQFADFRVLVVEDNINIRKNIVEALKGNYTIEEAENGLKGLEKAITSIPDLIISDVMMPEMDGFEMVRQLKEEEKTSHIPIIMLTARTSDRSKIKGLESGVADYLNKPFSNDVLRARIKNIFYTRKKLWEKFALDLAIQPKDITSSSSDEEFLKKAISIVENNLEKTDFDVDVFVQMMGMSRSALYRQLGQIIGQPVSDFIRTIRLKRAAILLKEHHFNVSETAYRVGFSDTAVFSRAFKRHFGVPPADWHKN